MVLEKGLIRTEADRGMKYSKLALKEIDNDATKRSNKLTKEDAGFLTTIQIGGGMGRMDLAMLRWNLRVPIAGQ